MEMSVVSCGSLSHTTPSSSQMCQGDTQRMLEKLAVSSVQECVGLSLASQWENMLFVLCHSVSETVESLLRTKSG